MKIAIIGYGKMGHEIEKVAIERGHTIALIIDQNNFDELTVSNLQKCDVAIEFTTPHTAYSNYNTCFNAGVPVVSGTTGWLEQYDELTNICREKNQTFFYASNFSIGVNVFYEINKQLSRIMNNFANYDVDIEEIHHTQKLDAPSGTAISLANEIIKNVERKTQWVNNKTDNKQDLFIKSIREGQVVGTHTINYNSDVDFIEIKHFAKNRKGFALGAVLAAEFICDKKGIFGMNDLLKF